MSANDRQVGGTHYNRGTLPQHWDLVTMYGWDYFQSQIIKYLMRWREKNGVQDLEKAAHFLEKYIEISRDEQKVEQTPRLKRHELHMLHESEAESVSTSLVKTNAYIGFTYEGGTKDWDLFRCTRCRDEVRVSPGHSPHSRHIHTDADGSEPNAAYVNQG